MPDTIDTPQTNQDEDKGPEEQKVDTPRKPRRRLFFGLFAGLIGTFLVVPFAIAQSGWGKCRPKSPEEAKERARFFTDKL